MSAAPIFFCITIINVALRYNRKYQELKIKNKRAIILYGMAAQM